MKKNLKGASLRLWPPVRRAAGELGVIVIGVLIALTLESWWAEQRDQSREKSYLLALREEATSNIARVAGVINVSGFKSQALDRAEALLASEEPESNGSAVFESLLQGSGISVEPGLSRAVFQDLRDSGRLFLLRDEDTRRAILAHYSELEALSERQERWEKAIGSGLHALVSHHVPPGLVEQIGPRVRVADNLETPPFLREAVAELVAEENLRLEMNAARRALEAEKAILSYLLERTKSHLENLGGDVDSGQP